MLAYARKLENFNCFGANDAMPVNLQHLYILMQRCQIFSYKFVFLKSLFTLVRLHERFIRKQFLQSPAVVAYPFSQRFTHRCGTLLAEWDCTLSILLQGSFILKRLHERFHDHSKKLNYFNFSCWRNQSPVIKSLVVYIQCLDHTISPVTRQNHQM